MSYSEKRATTSRNGSASWRSAVDKRFSKLERRIDQVEQDRKYAEWRIHTNTEQMLDGLLKEVRAIADLLTRTR